MISHYLAYAGFYLHCTGYTYYHYVIKKRSYKKCKYIHSYIKSNLIIDII